MKTLALFFTIICLGKVSGQELYFSADGKRIKEMNVTVDSTKDNATTIFITYKGNTTVDAKAKLLKTGTLEKVDELIDLEDFEHTFKNDGEVGFRFTLKKGFIYKNVVDKSLMVCLLSPTNGVVKEDDSILLIRFKKKVKEDEDDYSDFEVSLLTGSNFSFFEKPKVNDFAGLLNVQMFDIWGKVGLNLGVSNINFSGQDPNFTDAISNAVLPRRNILIDPKAGFIEGAKFEAIEYKRELTQTIGSWSYFLQPTFRIHQDEKSMFLLVTHLELLAQKSESVISEMISRIDTQTVMFPRDSLMVLRSSRNPAPDRTLQQNFIHGYFGLGLQWNVKRKDKYNLALNIVNGFTTDNFKARREDLINLLNAPRLPLPVNRRSQYFYFVRAIFTEKYTKLNGTIGFDLRGNGNHPPQVALYFGVKIDFNQFFK